MSNENQILVSKHVLTSTLHIKFDRMKQFVKNLYLDKLSEAKVESGIFAGSHKKK